MIRAFLLILLLAAMGAKIATADVPYCAVEEVEIYYLGEWRAGRVLNLDRRDRLCTREPLVQGTLFWQAVGNHKSYHSPNNISPGTNSRDWWHNPNPSSDISHAFTKISLF